ncbi:MAG TPA: imidazole glycerol phosphate synthase subunit HisH [Gammaproteobacteria bacterium]|nr:imidazole glycerol phosphate synthase subunit HisH [Gammaproteobacteria bacterium]
MASIAIIDYGMGNLHSIAKALEHVAGDSLVFVSSDPDAILRAPRVVFPGVGAIRDCMSELQRLELDAVVREVARTRPLLGVCLGMQALLTHSEENEGTACLDVLAGEVRRFPEGLADARTGERLKVPHMGWNQVRQVRSHPLWKDIPDNSRFYFVHSYYTEPAESELAVGTTDYGIEFASVLARDNVFAAQFHPEKSQQAGLTLLANFVRWDGQP